MGAILLTFLVYILGLDQVLGYTAAVMVAPFAVAGLCILAQNIHSPRFGP